MRQLFVVLLGSVAAACAATGATPRPFPAPGPAPASAAVEPSAEGLPSASGDPYAVSGTALSLQGAPYRNGGTDPSGFDCSGFVWYVFDRHGIHVPRTVEEQFQAGAHVDNAEVRAGDLLFFDTAGAGGRATHVAISIGGDQFVHAPSTKGQVRVERLASSYWGPRFLEARRVQ
jgi:cell wall-associated NlpC family hydrolase